MTSPSTLWIEIPADSHFTIHNLPYGVFSTPTLKKRIGVAIGSYILDLKEAERIGFFRDILPDGEVLHRKRLNDLMALGRPTWQLLRQRIQEMFVKGHRSSGEKWAAALLVPQALATMHLPVRIGDYTDFYSSEEHATNVGKLFRPDNPLLPNWKHLPVAYHGRASSITVSGTSFHRPKGQIKLTEVDPPVFSPTRSLDFELEVAAIIGKSSALGQAIATDEVSEYIFGFVLFNDWSARDIQRWEYQPLGPFLAKNFFSSISPWVVTLDALEAFRVLGPTQDPAVLPYLQTHQPWHFDVALEVGIKPAGGSESVVCRTNFKHLYWSIAQQIAHHTVNGCNLNVGDVLASGTISGPSEGSFGSMLELTYGGKQPLSLADGTERRFIQDGDTVIMRGVAEQNGIRVGFGEVNNQVLSSL